MATLLKAFHHVVLPPQLPIEEDTDLDGIANELRDRLLSACTALARSCASDDIHDALRSLGHSLQQVSHDGRLDKHALIQLFDQLQGDNLLILHVTEQNATLNFRPFESQEDGTHYVRVEVFEVAAPSEVVLASLDRLRQTFPGRTVQIPRHVFDNAEFKDCLAGFLEHASVETLRPFQSTALKSGVTVKEVRDVADPSLISQTLMSILEAIGSAAPLQSLHKHVRDDVNFHKGDRPWRRHPFWLTLKVSAHRHLCHLLGPLVGSFCYKSLQCIFLQHLLRDVSGHIAPELACLLIGKLCRRIAKIETSIPAMGFTERQLALVQPIWGALSPDLEITLNNSKQKVEIVWTEFKRSTLRPVPPIPPRAAVSDTILELRISRSYLERILAAESAEQTQMQRISHTNTNQGRALDASSDMQKFLDKNQRLIEAMKTMELDVNSLGASTFSNDEICKHTGAAILKLLAAVSDSFVGLPEMMSPLLLLVFEAWAKMDQYAVAACPLLGEFRLRHLQSRIHFRSEPRHRPGIFSHHFAEAYLGHSLELQQMRDKIELDCDAARARKKLEWNEIREEYTMHSIAIEKSSCTCTRDANGAINIRGCTKCFHIRRRRNL
ncbi:hypothetical protein ANO11243_062190 [Dothideomycetidae sp. 11243]|nr:hypothetical protein ANO11243_062190 [fungal sp. No.11243]